MENLQRQFSTKNFAENWKPNQTLWINVALNFSVRENIILCATSVCFKWQVLWYFWHDAVKFKLLFIFVTAWCWICHLKTSRGTLYTIYFPNLHWKLLSYFSERNLLKLLPKILRENWKPNRTLSINFVLKFFENNVIVNQELFV